MYNGRSENSVKELKVKANEILLDSGHNKREKMSHDLGGPTSVNFSKTEQGRWKGENYT